MSRRTAADVLNAGAMPIHLRDTEMSDLLTLEGCSVLIVGGAGRNLGADCTRAVASLGGDVAIVDLNLDAAEVLAAEVSERWGSRAIALQGDVGSVADVGRFVAAAIDELGQVDVLVHNAGGATIGDLAPAPFVDSSSEHNEATIDLNLVGVMRVLRAVIPDMAARRSGRIVIVSSEAAKMRLLDRAAYSASKAGVSGLVRALAHEIGPQGVRINAVCPGVMIGADLLEMFSALDADETPRVLVDSFSRVSLERPCHPSEVANVVAFLATDVASYIHGQSISVGGGMADT